MASNHFGTLFKITTWGESHGPAIGVVIDGVPAGFELSPEDIQEELERRRPGKTPWTSPRKEEDKVQILSGTYRGKTTGAPLSLLIENKGADSRPYKKVSNLHKPGHAGLAYLEKYGIFDERGGGRASARETASRVAAGAVAKKILRSQNIQVKAFLSQVGPVKVPGLSYEKIMECDSPIFIPDSDAEKEATAYLESLITQGNSSGGLVEAFALGLPAGLGDPIYEKLEAKLASAMLSINATKSFEIGSGIDAVEMTGLEHNDQMELEAGAPVFTSNHSGGVLGGISTGQPLRIKVGFKPTSSIKISQKTLDLQNVPATFTLPPGSKHDPCVAIRGVIVVEAMMALVLVDCLLMQKALDHSMPKRDKKVYK